MSEIRDTERLVETYLNRLPTPQGGEGDARALADALAEFKPSFTRIPIMPDALVEVMHPAAGRAGA